jgi:hypothetical protein
MFILGVDYHPSVQQIAWVDKETGGCGERQLMHSDREAERSRVPLLGEMAVVGGRPSDKATTQGHDGERIGRCGCQTT